MSNKVVINVIKKYAVWLALGLTLLATYFTTQQEDIDAQKDLTINTTKVNKPHFLKLNADFTQEINPTFKLRADLTEAPSNLFTVVNQQATVDENAVVEEAPQTPSNPYIYAGKLIENDEVIVFLTDGVKNYAVKIGDNLGANWRVKDIYLPEVTLQFIPLNTEVKLYIGALN